MTRWPSVGQIGCRMKTTFLSIITVALLLTGCSTVNLPRFSTQRNQVPYYKLDRNLSDLRFGPSPGWMTVKSFSFWKAKKERNPGQNHLFLSACKVTADNRTIICILYFPAIIVHLANDASHKSIWLREEALNRVNLGERGPQNLFRLQWPRLPHNVRSNMCSPAQKVA